MNRRSARVTWSAHALAVTSCWVLFDVDRPTVVSALRVPGGQRE